MRHAEGLWAVHQEPWGRGQERRGGASLEPGSARSQPGGGAEHDLSAECTGGGDSKAFLRWLAGGLHK